MTKSVDDFQIQFDIVYPQTPSPSSCYSSRSSLALYIYSCSSLYYPVFRLPIKGLIGTSTHMCCDDSKKKKRVNVHIRCSFWYSA